MANNYFHATSPYFCSVNFITNINYCVNFYFRSISKINKYVAIRTQKLPTEALDFATYNSAVISNLVYISILKNRVYESLKLRFPTAAMHGVISLLSETKDFTHNNSLTYSSHLNRIFHHLLCRIKSIATDGKYSRLPLIWRGRVVG
jgi:hypothetical protein